MSPLQRTRIPVVDAFVAVFRRLLPTLEPRNIVALSSTAGGHPQVPHVDTPTAIGSRRYKNEDPNDVVPLAALVSLQAGTTVHVWPGSHREVQHGSDVAWSGVVHWSTRLELPKDSCLLFRQDLVHAGDGFVEDNVRCHFFLDDKAAPLRDTKTQLTALADVRMYRIRPQ